MKLCMKGKFVHVKNNMSKEQLCRVGVSDFWDVFSGPKSLRGFRETGPMQSTTLSSSDSLL